MNDRLDRELPVILNPRAGGGGAERRLRALAPTLEAHGYRANVFRTRGPGHAEEIARELAPCARVAVAGGDGTIWEAVNGFAARGGTPPDLALVPAGTGDALARDLGLSSPAAVAAALVGESRRRIDLARLRVDGLERVAFSVVGWGAFARINRRAERLRVLGRRRYEVATLLELARPRLASVDAEWSADPRDRGALLAVACLTRHTGRGMCLAPGAELDDGRADLVVIERGPRLRLGALLRRVHSGTHVASPLVRVERVARLRVDLGEGSWVVLDGEALPARRLELDVERRGLAVLAPVAAGPLPHASPRGREDPS